MFILVKMFIFVIAVVQAVISPAEYLSQKDRPKIAGHRGLSSVFPENTLQSFEGAMIQGTDFIELDVVINKEGKVIVAHDTYLSVVSNIEKHTEFKDRQRIRSINGQDRLDWWIVDFTLEELQTIGIQQVRGAYRPKIFDNLFTYPTLEQVILSVQAFNAKTKNSRNPDSKPVGILLEMKDYQYHLDYAGANIVKATIDLLRTLGVDSIEGCKDTVPIVLMGFDQDAVRTAQQLSDLPRVQLLKTLSNYPLSLLAEVTKYANILGPDLDSIWDPVTQAPRSIVNSIKEQGLLIYAWTFQDDSIFTQDLFNSKTSKGIYEKAIKTLNIAGLITEFPDVALAYAQAYRK